MKISFAPARSAKLKNLVIMVDSKGSPLPAAADALGKKSVNALKGDLKAHARFTGKAGQSALLPAPDSTGMEWVAVVVLDKSADANAARKAGASLSKKLDGAGLKDAAWLVEQPKGCKLSAAELAAEIGYGALLMSYRFDKYRTTQKPEEKPSLAKLELLLEKDHSKASTAFKPYQAIADGIFITRDLVSEPANVIYPESFAAECKKLTKLGVKVEVLSEAQMKKLGMGALLGVGQGSDNESKMVVMRWDGGKKGDKPLAFVGKGVTFDTGGISIKPAGGMEAMKWDMGGAGTVTGLMHALAARKAKANVVGVIGLVENMPSGKAQRPGDVVKTMSGKTVEVINTDAEGRLVLADALWYTQDRFKPQFMVNLATLTGAIIVSLGKSRAGLFSNNDKLADTLFATGEKEGERLWRLPINEEYEDHINSDIADMKNVGKPGQAGSISAAQFLVQYVNDTPWAHLDIAGVAWADADQDLCRKGASGFGVRLLDRLVRENYEK